jgi:hypothetical protein
MAIEAPLVEDAPPLLRAADELAERALGVFVEDQLIPARQPVDLRREAVELDLDVLANLAVERPRELVGPGDRAARDGAGDHARTDAEAAG